MMAEVLLLRHRVCFEPLLDGWCVYTFWLRDKKGFYKEIEHGR